MRRRPARHDDRLSVMRNHSGHEIDISIAVWLIDSERAFLGRRLVNGFLILRVYELASPYCVVAAGRIPHEDHEQDVTHQSMLRSDRYARGFSEGRRTGNDKVRSERHGKTDR